MIRAAFFGTPAAAVPVLAALAGRCDVRPVVTRPDKPRGRSGRPERPPVGRAADEFGLPVVQPERVSDIAGVLRRQRLDLAVVVAYGRIVPPDVLSIPARGFVNVHFSLLPRWRGASPVAHAILAGDEVTGVTLMQMDEGLDTGPVLAAVETPILPADTAGGLTARLAAFGARLVDDAMEDIAAGTLPARPQDDAAATGAPLLSTGDGHIDPSRPSVEVLRLVRAMHPWPSAWGLVDGDRFKVIEAAAGRGAGPAPGHIVADGKRVRLGTGDGGIDLIRVHPAGKAPMAAAAWMNGRRGEPARLR